LAREAYKTMLKRLFLQINYWRVTTLKIVAEYIVTFFLKADKKVRGLNNLFKVSPRLYRETPRV
jgi:hypothetical protein